MAAIVSTHWSQGNRFENSFISDMARWSSAGGGKWPVWWGVGLRAWQPSLYLLSKIWWFNTPSSWLPMKVKHKSACLAWLWGWNGARELRVASRGLSVRTSLTGSSCWPPSCTPCCGTAGFPAANKTNYPCRWCTHSSSPRSGTWGSPWWCPSPGPQCYSLRWRWTSKSSGPRHSGDEEGRSRTWSHPPSPSATSLACRCLQSPCEGSAGWRWTSARASWTETLPQSSCQLQRGNSSTGLS